MLQPVVGKVGLGRTDLCVYVVVQVAERLVICTH